jgi:hypothetical protein
LACGPKICLFADGGPFFIFVRLEFY